MNLGQTIYRLRTERGMSQEDLSNELGVSRQSISKWENNSAVPELEKLLTMSRLFGVTLDQLVNEEVSPSEPPAPELPPAPESSSTVEPPAASGQQIPGLSGVQLMGGVLLLCALLFVVITWAVKGSDDAMTALLIAAPVALCGIACLVMKHPLVLCGWLGYIEYLLLFFVLSPRWEEATFGIILSVVLALGMIALTVRQHRRGITVLPWWLWSMGLIVLAALLLLLLLNTIPPSEGHVTPARPTPVESLRK